MLKRFVFACMPAVAPVFLMLACFASASVTFAVQGSGHWTLESVLRQLDQEARTFRSLTADMERTKVTVVVNDKSTETGKIFVRRDDKMRIEFNPPDEKTVLRSGNEFSLYNPKIKQVEDYDLGKHRALVDEFLLLGFGTSGADLQKGYLVTLIDEE